MTTRFLLDSAHPFPGQPASLGKGELPLADETGPGGGLSLNDWLEFLRGQTGAVFPAGDSAVPVEQPGVLIPEHYEHKYAYPLIIWVVDGKRTTTSQGVGLLSGISSRNYLGLVFRPDSLTTNSDGSLTISDDPAALERDADRLRQQVTELRRSYHVHSERIFVGGAGLAGTWALQMGLQQPDWFAGLFSLGGGLPQQQRLLRNFRSLQGKRVLLSRGQRDLQWSSQQLRSATVLLHSAGMQLCERTYDTGADIIDPMLRDIDRWVMREIYQPRMVRS